tara:strand:- start:267 stop:842 length:576 start_codon:yes stop_codon:yes gene_type:complete
MTIAYNDETTIINNITNGSTETSYLWQAKMSTQDILDETEEVVGGWVFALDINNPVNAIAKNDFTNYQVDHGGEWTCPKGGAYAITVQLNIYGGSPNELRYGQVSLQKTTGLSTVYQTVVSSQEQMTTNTGAGVQLHLINVTINNVILEFQENEKLRTTAKINTDSVKGTVFGYVSSPLDMNSYWNITRVR